MPVAIDTSVLIAAEKIGGLEPFIAAQLAALNAELCRTGKVMGFFDAAIAATVIARRDSLLVVDSDFDRLSDRIELLKP